MKSVERRKEARPGCRSHEDGKREGGEERKSCMHVRRRTWSPCDRLTGGVKVLLMAYPIQAERGI